MSSPRYDWWGYVKGMIRRYPDLKREYAALHQQSVTQNYTAMPGGGGASRSAEIVALRELPSTKQREYEAVRSALEMTAKMESGSARLKLVELVFFKKSHTLSGAAMVICYSYGAAKDFHGDFIRMVAKNFGLLDQ